MSKSKEQEAFTHSMASPIGRSMVRNVRHHAELCLSQVEELKHMVGRANNQKLWEELQQTRMHLDYARQKLLIIQQQMLG